MCSLKEKNKFDFIDKWKVSTSLNSAYSINDQFLGRVDSMHDATLTQKKL